MRRRDRFAKGPPGCLPSTVHLRTELSTAFEWHFCGPPKTNDLPAVARPALRISKTTRCRSEPIRRASRNDRSHASPFPLPRTARSITGFRRDRRSAGALVRVRLARRAMVGVVVDIGASPRSPRSVCSPSRGAFGDAAAARRSARSRAIRRDVLPGAARSRAGADRCRRSAPRTACDRRAAVPRRDAPHRVRAAPRSRDRSRAPRSATVVRAIASSAGWRASGRRNRRASAVAAAHGARMARCGLRREGDDDARAVAGANLRSTTTSSAPSMRSPPRTARSRRSCCRASPAAARPRSISPRRDACIAAGGQALFLVPEINLTPQLEQRIAARCRASAPSRCTAGSRRRAARALARGGRRRGRPRARHAARRVRAAAAARRSSSSTKSTIRRSSSRTACATTAATSPSGARGSAAFRSCSAARRRRWKRLLHAQRGRYRLADAAAARGRAGAAAARVMFVPDTAPGALEGISAPLRRGDRDAARARRAVAASSSTAAASRRRSCAPPAAGRPACPRCSARLVVHRDDRRAALPSLRHTPSGLPRACPDCGNVDLLPMGHGTQRLERALDGALSRRRGSRASIATARAARAHSPASASSVRRRRRRHPRRHADAREGPRLPAPHAGRRRWAPTTRCTAPTSARPSASPRCLFQVAGRAGRAATARRSDRADRLSGAPARSRARRARLRRLRRDAARRAARRGAAAVRAPRAARRGSAAARRGRRVPRRRA